MMVLSMSACGGSDSSADTTAAQETEAEVTVETEAAEAETEELPDLVGVEGATIWDILRVETPDLTNTRMNDTLVLVAVPDESGTTGLYFSQN